MINLVQSPRRAIELWKTGETAELLNSFPEFKTVIEPVHDELERVAEWCVKDFAENTPCADRKTFALAVKNRPWSAVLFRMLDQYVNQDDVATAKVIMRRLSTAVLERMMVRRVGGRVAFGR